MNPSGRYVKCSTAGEPVEAFVPNPLPPEPSVQLEDSDYDLMEKANRALGRLDAVSTLLPDASLFIYSYVRREALLSSQIEGTQSSFSDLLRHEAGMAPGVPLDDVREVSTYVVAMEYGLKRLREDDSPLCVRLLRESHRVLLSSGRGARQAPGEFRRSQNWIGGTRPGNAVFVPPPHERVPECMSRLEQFLNDRPERTPTLIKAAFAHAQFETIHPFLDGNGRLGRLLVTLLLCSEGVLKDPLLYLSLYFKRNRTEYYDHLQRVRTEGAWLAWLRFFLNGVHYTAQQASDTANRLTKLFDRDQTRIEKLGRKANSALRLYLLLKKRPLTTVPKATEELDMAAPTVSKAVDALQELGILNEITGKQRGRVYAYSDFVNILSEGTEPL